MHAFSFVLTRFIGNWLVIENLLSNRMNAVTTNRGDKVGRGPSVRSEHPLNEFYAGDPGGQPKMFPHSNGFVLLGLQRRDPVLLKLLDHFMHFVDAARLQRLLCQFGKLTLSNRANPKSHTCSPNRTHA